jgi:hypothetical protein
MKKLGKKFYGKMSFLVIWGSNMESKVIILKRIDSEIEFSFLNGQKPSLFTNLDPKHEISKRH